MDIFSSFRLTNRILGYSRRLSLHSSTDFATDCGTGSERTITRAQIACERELA